MAKRYSWIKIGAKCKWNDPAITDYPKNKRKEILNRIFTIVGISDEEFDEDTIIEIDDGVSFAEVYPNELKKLDKNLHISILFLTFALSKLITY